ncbi:hypothetical protein [Candidatus Caldatribacterium sp.]|uniref:hypothetical protein n=1 Tax=Candidatus Caldatribacterium sp. TaxID=2282143 RepID=UPI00383F05BA|nr:hypothetical protein [Candidatus Caldatribacterium sp.]
MILFDEQAVKSYLNPPDDVTLAAFAEEYGIPTDEGTIPTPADYFLAATLYYVKRKYPKAREIDAVSFASLVSNYTTGVYGGFGTEHYRKEIEAMKFLMSLLGGTYDEESGVGWIPEEVTELQGDQKAWQMFSRFLLAALEDFYFEEEGGL